MKTTSVLCAFLTIFSGKVLANDSSSNNVLTAKEEAHIFASIITLKLNCLSKKEETCVQADAVYKLFKQYKLERLNSIDENSGNLELYMTNLFQGFVAGKSNSKKTYAGGCPPGYRNAGENRCESIK